MKVARFARYFTVQWDFFKVFPTIVKGQQLQYSVYLGLTSVLLCSSFFLSVFATDRIVQMFAFQIKVDLFASKKLSAAAREVPSSLLLTKHVFQKKVETFDKNQKVFGLIETCLFRQRMKKTVEVEKKKKESFVLK